MLMDHTCRCSTDLAPGVSGTRFRNSYCRILMRYACLPGIPQHPLDGLVCICQALGEGHLKCRGRGQWWELLFPLQPDSSELQSPPRLSTIELLGNQFICKVGTRALSSLQLCLLQELCDSQGSARVPSIKKLSLHSATASLVWVESPHTQAYLLQLLPRRLLSLLPCPLNCRRRHLPLAAAGRVDHPHMAPARLHTLHQLSRGG